jgi:hypothetical protein
LLNVFIIAASAMYQTKSNRVAAVNDWSLSGHPVRAVAWLTDKYIGIVTIR